MDVDWRKEPNAPEPGTIVCQLSDLQEGVPKEFSFGDSEPFRILLYRVSEQLVAYVNRCPHHWIAMNRPDAGFTMWDAKKHELMCVHHTAVFQLLDEGRCTNGPCRSSNLIRVPLRVEGYQVKIEKENLKANAVFTSCPMLD